MGTSIVVIGAAAGVVVLLALVAGLTFGARRRADARTEAAIRRIGESIGGISMGLEHLTVELEEFKTRAGPERFGTALGITLDLDELLLRIAAAAASLPGVDAGAVRTDRRSGPVERSVGLVSGATGLESSFDPPDRSPWQAVELSWRHPVGAGGEPVRSALVVPVEHEGKRLGVIGAYARTARGIGEAIADELVRLAADAAPALDAALVHADTKDLVVTDALTGVSNRRGYDDGLARECALAARSGRALSLLIVDLDEFRSVNSRFGYPVGDAVLVAFSDALRAVARVTDVACRRGGEEFALILPDTTGDGALEVDRRLRDEVARTGVAGVGPVTFSGGIACWTPGSGQTFPTAGLLDMAASEGVRRAKELGKNRTELVPLDPDAPLAPGAPAS